mmetsp:Transcript_132366/g.264017  ORF Transcript_132366/g.264017 Transcript_132366/m.264017 type:complete len:427 (+) Transcript_132366:31-1311(+)
MGTAIDLPSPVTQEILRRYADVLRVGSVHVNGQVVRWDTRTSTEGQLWNFSEALFNRLRQLPELSKASDEVLHQATYWVCKAVSINYALMEVLLLVRRKAGCMCTIETADDLGCLVTYAIEVRPDQMVHIRLCWRGKNNIVYRDPLTASRKVKGTLSCMETEFPLPPVKRFAPCYRLHMKFKRSLPAKFASTMTCKDVRRKQGVAETVLIEDPLYSEVVQPISMAPPTITDEVFDIDAACEELLMIQRCTSAGSFSDIALPRRHSSTSIDTCSPLGLLRVQGLHAKDIQWRLASNAPSTMCCRLVCGTTEERTSAVPYSPNPEWNEVFDFPVLAGELHGDVLLELIGVVNKQELVIGHARVPASTVLISSTSNNRALMSERIDGQGLGSTAHMNMELLFIPDETGCEETCASDGEESQCSDNLGAF